MFHIWGLDPALGLFPVIEHQKYIHSDDFPRFEDALGEAVEHGIPYELELRLNRPDGTEKTIITICEPQLDPSGKVVKLIGTIQDITERKIAEDALRESEQSFRTLSNSGMALIWTSGVDKLCNYFNSVWLEFTGRALEQEMGNGWVEGVYPDDLQRCLDIYVEAFDRQEKFSMEYRLRRHDGTYRWIVDEGCPCYDSHGEFLGYIGHCLDIDERRRVAENLQESENKFRFLFENMINGFAYHNIITNENGKPVDYEFIEVNKVFEKLTGLRREDIIGKRITTVHPGIEDMEFDWIGTYGNVALTGESITFEQFFQPQQHWYSVLAYCPRRGSFAVTFEDITQRKQAEEKLRASQQILEGIINSIPSRVFWKNTHLVYMGCNTIFARDAGFHDPKDIIGKDEYMMGWREQAELYRNDDRQVIESGVSKLLIEEHQTTPEGKVINLLTSKVPLRNSDGEISGVLGTYMDITEHKRLEEEKL